MPRRAGPALHLPPRLLDRRRRSPTSPAAASAWTSCKTNIEQIGGTIDVALGARPRAPTFTIKIPLTLAIVSALIVEAGGERFAIPQIGVRRAGAGRRQGRAHASSASRTRRCCGCATGCCRWSSSPACCGCAGPSRAGDDRAFVVVTQVGTGSLRHHRRPRVRHRGDRGQAGGARSCATSRMFSGNTILGDGASS